MEIPVEELKRSKGYLTYEKGYRIVYFYEKYHEALQGVHTYNIKEFMSEFKENDIIPKYISDEDILNRFLDKNNESLGVAIYDVSGELILRKNKDNVNTPINNSEVYKEELIYDYGNIYYENGYRVIYYYDDYYSIGSYCKTLEGFMIEFVEHEPIIDDSDIPDFISVDDLLDRYLKDIPDIIAVAIYKVDGTCVARKDRNNIKTN